MNKIEAKKESRTKGFIYFTPTHTILLLVTVLICAILFVKILPLPFEKEAINLEKDNAVPQVEDYIKKNILKDAETLEIIHWSKLVKRTALDMLAYRIGLVYKIKSPDGNSRMESKIFDLDKNKNVMFEINVPPFENMR